MGNLTGTVEPENETDNYEIDPTLKEKAYALENEYIDKYCSPLTRKELYYKDIPIDYHGNSYIHALIRGEESEFFHFLPYSSFNKRRIHCYMSRYARLRLFQ